MHFLCHRIGRLLFVALFVSSLGRVPTVWGEEEKDPKRWEETIQEFEASDKENLPPQNAVLFLGSSSIRKWDLKKSFPKLAAINRGFGGSHIQDSLYYMDRIVLPYRPRTIVFYAGDNDIKDGKSPERVVSDYKLLVRKVHEVLPKTRFIYIYIKPSISRWEYVEPMREVNRAIAKLSKRDKRLTVLDIDSPMIGEDGRPRKELFDDDDLHLNERGYKLWDSLLKPFLLPLSQSATENSAP